MNLETVTDGLRVTLWQPKPMKSQWEWFGIQYTTFNAWETCYRSSHVHARAPSRRRRWILAWITKMMLRVPILKSLSLFTASSFPIFIFSLFLFSSSPFIIIVLFSYYYFLFYLLLFYYFLNFNYYYFIIVLFLFFLFISFLFFLFLYCP